MASGKGQGKGGSDGVCGILDELKSGAEGEGEVSVGDVIDTIGHRGTGVFFLVPGLLGISPLSAIPTVPTLIAVIVALIAVQVVAGKNSPWLPGVLRDRTVQDDKLCNAVDKMRGVAGWLDRHFGHRMEGLTGDPANRLAAIMVVALCVTVPPLELVPFAAALPFAAIAMFGLALTLRDGAVMLAAFAISTAALWGAVSMAGSGGG